MSFVPNYEDIRISVSGTSRYALQNLYLDRDQIDTLVATYAMSPSSYGEHHLLPVFTSFACSGYRYGFNGMEKDDEVKGRGNSYDFGARMYDSRLGRWLTIDPLAGKYPSLSPYNFVANSPLIFVDPTGMSGIAYLTGEKNKEGKPIVRVVTNIYIYGEGATINRAKLIQEEANLLYNNGGDFFTTSIDGIDYEVQFQFDSKIIDEKDVNSKMIEGDYYNLNAENNFYEVRDDIESSVTLTVVGGNTGALKTSDIDDGSKSLSHELNHGYNGINLCRVRIPMHNDDPNIAVPKNRTTSPKDRRVTQENIDYIFKDVSFKNDNKANLGTARPFKYDKSSHGNSIQIPQDSTK